MTHPAIKNIYSDEEFRRRMAGHAVTLRLLGQPHYIVETLAAFQGRVISDNVKQAWYDLAARLIAEARKRQDLLTKP